MEIHITIKGVTPLLMNKMTSVAEQTLLDGKTAPVHEGELGTPQEQAMQKIWRNEDGQPTLPTHMIFSSFMNGGRRHKIGKKQVTTQKESLLPGCLQIDDLYTELKYKELNVDSRPITTKTGEARMQHRPRFEEWECNFTIQLDTETMSRKLLRKIVDDAGKFYGIGSFRPQCKGQFGKFVVSKWAETHEEINEPEEVEIA